MSDVSSQRAHAALERPRFELVPVKGVDEELDFLPPRARVTITSSPSKGMDATLALGERLRERDFTTVPHVSARLVSSKEQVRRIVERVAQLGQGGIFVIGGDIKEPAGPYVSSLSLLRDIREVGYEGTVGVASYPEPHPFIPTDELWRTLSEKQEYASYAVTQICFDARRIVDWLGEMRARDIGLPVWIGFPGVVERRRLMRIALRIGVGVSSRYLTKQGDLVARLVRPGGYNPDELVHALEPYVADETLGIAGYHINTFNQVAGTERWRRAALEAAETSEVAPPAAHDKEIRRGAQG